MIPTLWGHREHVATATTMLFVPGDRPERFTKADASGADLVVLDLEDAVAPGRKDEARSHVVRRIENGPPCAVRINPVGTQWHDADLEALRHHSCTIMLPKTERPEDAVAVAAAAPDTTGIVALIETASGVLAAAHVAAAPPVLRLAFGSFDLAVQLAVSPGDREALLAARSALVLASAAAGLAGPIDGVTGNLKDDDALRDDIAYARRLGLTGKLCVHPRQVGVAAEAFRPTAAELVWARKVVATGAAGGGGVTTLDGQMIDAPVVARAHRILHRERS